MSTTTPSGRRSMVASPLSLRRVIRRPSPPLSYCAWSALLAAQKPTGILTAWVVRVAAGSGGDPSTYYPSPSFCTSTTSSIIVLCRRATPFLMVSGLVRTSSSGSEGCRVALMSLSPSACCLGTTSFFVGTAHRHPLAVPTFRRTRHLPPSIRRAMVPPRRMLRRAARPPIWAAPPVLVTCVRVGPHHLTRWSPQSLGLRRKTSRRRLSLVCRCWTVCQGRN
jgi:hypothetical protein